MLTRPIIQYPGGKWLLAPWILQYEPEHSIYVEPFGGGGNILLRKSRSKIEVYNDLNKEVVTLFRVLRDKPQELEDYMRLTPYSKYLFQDAIATSSMEDVAIACNLLVKVSWSYGTEGFKARNIPTWRVSKTPEKVSQAQSWKRLPEYIKDYCERLQGVFIENSDAIKVIEKFDSVDTWHYVDPPYVLDTRVEKKLYEYEMTDKEHEALSDTLHSVKGKVALSGYSSGLYDRLYKDWICFKHKAYSSGIKDGQLSSREECLWLNYSVENELPFWNINE